MGFSGDDSAVVTPNSNFLLFVFFLLDLFSLQSLLHLPVLKSGDHLCTSESSLEVQSLRSWNGRFPCGLSFRTSSSENKILPQKPVPLAPTLVHQLSQCPVNLHVDTQGRWKATEVSSSER